MNYFLAVDIGASSGRHIVGWQENGQLQTKEVYRFPNGVETENGHLVWNIGALFSYVKNKKNPAHSNNGIIAIFVPCADWLIPP